MDLLLIVGTPVLAFLGALLGQRGARRTALELERWRRREETMRMLRWAVEMTTDDDRRRSHAGLATLDALLDSPLLDVDDKPLVARVAGEAASVWVTTPRPVRPLIDEASKEAP
jgi:hypothetical protein